MEKTIYKQMQGRKNEQLLTIKFNESEKTMEISTDGITGVNMMQAICILIESVADITEQTYPDVILDCMHMINEKHDAKVAN